MNKHSISNFFFIHKHIIYCNDPHTSVDSIQLRSIYDVTKTFVFALKFATASRLTPWPSLLAQPRSTTGPPQKAPPRLSSNKKTASFAFTTGAVTRKMQPSMPGGGGVPIKIKSL